MNKRENDFDYLMRLAAKYEKETDPDRCITVLKQALDIKPRDSQLDRRIGRMYLLKKRPDEALEHFQKSLKLGGPKARLYYGIGIARFDKNDFLGALDNFERSLGLGVDNRHLYYSIALTCMRLGKNKRAFDYFLKSAEKGCTEPFCYYTLGNVFFNKGEYAEAKKHLRKAIKLGPEYGEPHFFLGIIYAETAKVDLAIEHLEEALRLGIRSPRLHSNLGMAYVGKKYFKKAEDQFRRIINMKQGGSKGYTELAVLHILRRQWNQAQKSLAEARRMGLSDQEWYDLSALLCEGKGQTDKAIEFSKAALKADPEDAVACARLGKLYGSKGKTTDAILHLKRALKLDPAVFLSAFYLGIVYLMGGKWEDCKKCAERIASVDKESPWAYCLLGLYYLERDDLEQATNYAKQAMKSRVQLPYGYELLGTIHFLRNNLDQAIYCLAKAMELTRNPDYTYYLRLGVAYYSKNKLKKAKTCLEMAVRMHPECGEAYFFLGIIIFTQEFKNNLALSTVRLSEKKPWQLLDQKHHRIQVSYVKNLIAGMLNWQNGAFGFAKKHFLECARISERIARRWLTASEGILLSIVSFDERLQLLRMAPSFEVMKHDLSQLLEEMARTLGLLEREDPGQTTLGMRIIPSKIAVAEALMEALRGHGFSDVHKEMLEAARARLINLRFTKAAVALDLIETFAFEFSNEITRCKSLRKIPKDTLDSYLGRVKGILEPLGEKMSVTPIGLQCAEILSPHLKDIQREIMSWRSIKKQLRTFLEAQPGSEGIAPRRVAKHEETAKTKKEIAAVSFYRTRVEIFDGILPRRPAKEYPWRLLELLLQRKRIHWTYGFLIFDRWRSDPGPKYPKETINSYIATLNGRTKDSLSHNKIPIKIEKDEETGEIYLDEYDRLKFSSNIFSAEERIQKVKDILARGDSEALEDAKKSLVDIVDGKEGYYNSYEAYKLLIQCLKKTGFRKEDERLITKVAEFFKNKILAYEESFYAIEVHRKRIPQTYYWKGTDKAVDKMRKELRELERQYKIIAPRAAKKRVSENFSDVIRLIGEVKDLKLPYELLFEEKAFKELTGKDSIKPMLNSIISNILNNERLENVPPEDIMLAILPNFAKVINRVKTSRFQSLPPLIKHLKTSTERRTEEKLIKREYDIPVNIQRDIRRKSKVLNELAKELGQEPGDVQVYKRLSWSKEKQREIRMHESKLWKVHDFNEEQYKDETL